MILLPSGNIYLLIPHVASSSSEAHIVAPGKIVYTVLIIDIKNEGFNNCDVEEQIIFDGQNSTRIKLSYGKIENKSYD